MFTLPRARARRTCSSHARPKQSPIAQEGFALRHRRSWARLVKNMFHVDALLCAHCGREMKIVSLIDSKSAVVERIPRQLETRIEPSVPHTRSAGEFGSVSTSIRGILSPALKSICLLLWQREACSRGGAIGRKQPVAGAAADGVQWIIRPAFSVALRLTLWMLSRVMGVMGAARKKPLGRASYVTEARES